MNPTIKARFDDACLGDALTRYQLDSRHKLLSDWHAFTFEVYLKDRPFILRVSDDTHRTPADIEGELEWMTFVGKSGVSVPAVVASKHGRSIEVMDAGPSTFTAVLFERLGGRPVMDTDWNAKLFERWGALVGSLHRLGTQFCPTKHRAQWHDSDFLNVDAYIPDELHEIKQAAHELIEEIKSFPREPSSFGMMHADVYQDNFFISGDGLQLFDFDNCEWGFFANDVAVSLYAALWRLPPEGDRQAFATEFLKSFWQGYRAEFFLDPLWVERLPLFLRLRDLVIYIVARKKLDLNNLTPIQERLLKERGARIARRTPIVDIAGIF